LYIETGEGEEAGLLLLRKAVSLDDVGAEHWYRLSCAFHLLGREKDALEAVRTCLRLERTHVPGLLLLGKLLSATGKGAQAHAALRRVLKAKNATRVERRSAEKTLLALD